MPSELPLDALDHRLNEIFEGKVVRKDLLHRIKKGTNVPTFVLEFLLARYCASNEPAEIQAGMEVVLATLQENHVRPDEANAAQSRVGEIRIDNGWAVKIRRGLDFYQKPDSWFGTGANDYSLRRCLVCRRGGISGWW